MSTPIYFYFVAQTGRLSMHPIRSNNFHCYKLDSKHFPVVRDTVLSAPLGSGGLEYTPEFLALINKEGILWR